MEKRAYLKFLIMLAVSFCIMYGVMFLNVDDAGHLYLSLTRTYMSLLMVSPMAILMLVLMRNMYMNRKWNAVIATLSAFVFFLALGGLRTQSMISDVQYMKAMIPHHSSAIMTSKYANMKDPEVKKLSDSIIASQEREIRQMKKILERMEH